MADMHLIELHSASAPPPRVAANERTDACIIAASRRDPDAFAELFDRYWPGLHAFCCGRPGASGEDVAAETFRVVLTSADVTRVSTSALTQDG